jgi:site-specific recombinase XerD
MAQLLYGSGLRLLECIRLSVKDIDFANNLLIIRSGKGEKDRTTVLPDRLKEPLQSHLKKIKQMHNQDLANSYGKPRFPMPWRRNTHMPTGNGVGMDNGEVK